IDNNNKINLEDFFEEVCNSNVDIEALHENIEVVVIKKEQSFDDFKQTKSYFKIIQSLKTLRYK
ncbi:4733_t:CDS:1, partial [Racocetra persica]